MSEVLAHRGPDGEGIFADRAASRSGTAGSRSSTSATPAPSRSQSTDGAAAPGPQRRDLQLPRAPRRARGSRPSFPAARPTRRSSSHAYREWGDRCVERFNGMWAFAIWDGTARAALLLARPLRREAVLLPLDDGRLRVRERAEGVPRRSGDAPAGRTCEASATTSSRDCARPHRRDVLRRHREAAAGAHARRSTATGCARSGTGSSSSASRPRAIRSARCASCSSTRCGCGCAATCPSARASPAASTRRRSPASSTSCFETEAENARPGGRAPADVHRVLRGLRRSTSGRTRETVVARTKADAALDLVHGRGPRRDNFRRSSKRRTSRSARRASSRQLVRHARGQQRRTSRSCSTARAATRSLAGLSGVLRRPLRRSPACKGAFASSRARARGAPASPRSRRQRSQTLAQPFAPAALEPRLRERRSGVVVAAAREPARTAGTSRSRRLAVPGPAAALQTRDPDRAGLPELLHATRTATRWRIRSRRACRSSTTGSSSCCSHSTASS